MRLFAAIAAFLLLASHAHAELLPVIDAVVYTQQGEVCLKLEVAATPKAREQGLMNRRSLKPNDGMLFLFPKSGDHAFWMKSTPLPLDMVFVSTGRSVVHVAADTTPYSLDLITAGRKIRSVVELNAGRAAKEGIAVGDNLRYDLPDGFEIY